MAPEVRPHPTRSRVRQRAGGGRAGGAADLDRPVAAAGDRAGVVERAAVVLPGGDPPGKPAQLDLSTCPCVARVRVAVLPPLPQHAPRVAPDGPLPRLALEPKRSRRWTPWQHLCAALLRDAVKCASSEGEPNIPTRKNRQRIADLRWLSGVPAPLDFPTVCAILELEPTAVRRALRRR